MTLGIFCLESLWSPTTESSRASVAPLVEFIGRSYNARHATFVCGTAEELELRLRKSRKGGYGILYMAGHGNKGRFKIDNGEVTLEQMAEMMGERFEGWFVHFGSCSMLDVKLKVVKQFKHDTGAARVSGYRKPVDWAPSSALDLVWLSHLVSGEKFDREMHQGMMNKLGFALV